MCWTHSGHFSAQMTTSTQQKPLLPLNLLNYLKNYILAQIIVLWGSLASTANSSMTHFWVRSPDPPAENLYCRQNDQNMDFSVSMSHQIAPGWTAFPIIFKNTKFQVFYIAWIIHNIGHLISASVCARREFICLPALDTVHVSSFYWVIFDDKRRASEKDRDSFELIDLRTCEIAVWLLEGHFVCVCVCAYVVFYKTNCTKSGLRKCLMGEKP